MYREQELPCPQCGVPLVVLDSRAKWRCKQCVGALVGIEQIELELGQGGRQTIFATAQAQRTGTRPCPACREPMEPIRLVGVEIDRCVADGYAWFDRGELGRACREITHEVDAVASVFLANLVR